MLAVVELSTEVVASLIGLARVEVRQRFVSC